MSLKGPICDLRHFLASVIENSSAQRAKLKLIRHTHGSGLSQAQILNLAAFSELGFHEELIMEFSAIYVVDKLIY